MHKKGQNIVRSSCVGCEFASAFVTGVFKIRDGEDARDSKNEDSPITFWKTMALN